MAGLVSFVFGSLSSFFDLRAVELVRCGFRRAAPQLTGNENDIITRMALHTDCAHVAIMFFPSCI